MKFFHKLPIRTQMFFNVTLAIIAVVGLLLFTYNQTAKLVSKNNESLTNEILIQMKQTVSSNYDVIQWLSYNIGYNNTVQDLLLMEREQLPTNTDTYTRINNLLLNLSTMKSGVLDLIIIGKNGVKLSLNSGLSDLESFGFVMPESNKPYVSSANKCFISSSRQINCLAVGTTIYSNVMYEQYTKEIGTVYMLINPVMLFGGGGLETKQEGASTLLLDRDGQVLLGTDPDMLGESFDIRKIIPDKTSLIDVNGKLTHVQIEELPQIQGHIVRLIPDEVFYHDIHLLKQMSIIAMIVGVLLLSVPFFLMVNNIIAPLRTLYSYMKIKRPEDLNKEIVLHGSTEAEVIGKQFNQMMQEITGLTNELVHSKEKLLHAEIEKNQAEFKFLKSQVNPHFLYNTLDSIRGIAIERKVPEINEMTKSLSRIFRYSVKGNEFVSLKEELEMVSAYMQIQSTRFAGRFQYEAVVPESLLECRIPKMILQPIVENAVIHGLEPLYRLGSLVISTSEDNDRQLLIRISDNGAGMTEEKALRINDTLLYSKEVETDETGQGIGLVNVNNRIKFMYGPEYGVSLRSTEGMGTEVLLKLPLQCKEADIDVSSNDY